MKAAGWPSDEGWPYSDDDTDVGDRAGEPDWDLIALHARAPHLLDGLDSVERTVVTARFGLDDGGARSMKEIRRETGLDHEQVRSALGSGLAKLRHDLADGP